MQRPTKLSKHIAFDTYAGIPVTIYCFPSPVAGIII